MFFGDKCDGKGLVDLVLNVVKKQSSQPPSLNKGNSKARERHNLVFGSKKGPNISGHRA